MFLKKYCVLTLLLCTIIKVTQVESDNGEAVFKGLLPILSTVVGGTITGPLAPILMGSLGMIGLATNILTSEDEGGQAVTRADLLEKHTEVMNSLKDIRTELTEGTRNLMHTMKTHGFMEEMRNDLDELSQGFSDNMKVILNDKITGITKKTSMHAMIDYFSSFRETLRSFVTKYIKAKGVMATSGNVNLFYDYLLEKEQALAEKNEDCYYESTHTKLFKSFMYMLKILTDAYVMVTTAHTVQYQNELKAGETNEAAETQQISLKILNQYKIDMKSFMDKTKWALDNASRDIRNCGAFKLQRGVTHDTISFAYLLPKFKDWDYDHNAWYSSYRGPTYSCYTREEDVKYKDYTIVDNQCTDGGLAKPGAVEVFVNKNADWPYKYLKNNPTLSADKVYGNSKAGSNGLVSRKFSSSRSCYSTFCPAFKKNAVGINRQIIRAEQGNVITGLRFRVDSHKIIYIDIQEAEFKDDMTVDQESVIWTETPPSNDILYLDSNVRHLELGDFDLEDNLYLTSIQLDLKNKLKGIIGLKIGGSNAPDWEPSTPKDGPTPSSKSNEVVISKRDTPDQFDADKLNLISKPPVKSEGYHVSFQPSDFDKDLGATTIPWFDVRDVMSYPPIPLGGCGLYHQAVEGSSGFVALKLKAPKLNHFIDFKLIDKAIVLNV